MNNTLTPKQVKNLHTAIDRAEGKGVCRYATEIGDGVVPRCIVGQLGALEGIPPEEMERWGTETCNNVLTFWDNAKPLREYPLGLLRDLQIQWDTKVGTEAIARRTMHVKVDDYVESYSILTLLHPDE